MNPGTEEVSEKTIQQSAGTREEQIAELLQKLEGHEAFKLVRGKFDLTMIDLYRRLSEKDDTTSAFKKRWDELMKATSVMSRMLKTLECNGKKEAWFELEQALGNSAYIIRGQTVPSDDMTPATLVMFRTKTTMEIFRWILFNSIAHTEPITGVSNNEIFTHYVDKLLSEVAIPEEAIPYGLHWDYHHGIMNAQASVSGCASNSGYSAPFFFLFIGDSRDEVFSKIHAAEHSDLSLWELAVPWHYSNFRSREIGLYSDTEHSSITPLCPSLACREAVNGLRTIIIPACGSSDTRKAFHWNNEWPLHKTAPIRLLLKESGGGRKTWKKEY